MGTPAAFVVAVVGALLIGGPPAAADTDLVEKATPFELPMTFTTPHAYVADAAPGTNGTAHLVVTSIGGAYYLWVNVADGSVIESVNLTQKGFEIGVYDYWYYYYYGYRGTYDFRFAVIESYGSRVVISHAFSFAGADVMFFDEGHAAAGVRERVYMPASDPGPGYESWSLGDYAAMPNAADPARPSIAWARSAYTSSSVISEQDSVLEIGRLDLDMVNGTAGAPYTVSLMRGASVSQAPSNPYLTSYPDDWRIQYAANALAGAIDASGTASIFALTYEWKCTHYYSGSSCYVYYPSLNWTLFRADGSHESLANITAFATPGMCSTCYEGSWAFLDAIPSPDGAVAAFLTIPGNTSTIVYGSRVSGGVATTSAVALGGYPVIGAEPFIDGASVKLLVSDIVNGTPMAHGRLREVTGWPDALASGNTWEPAHPLERMTVTAGGASPQVVGGGLVHPTRSRMSADASVFRNVSFERSWPAIATLQSSATLDLDMRSWDAAVRAPVLDSAVVTLPGGAQAGVLVTNENGTGVARVIFASGSPPQFSLSAPLDLQGDVQSARVIEQGGVAVAVVQIRFDASGGGYGRVDYLMFTIGADGARSQPTSIYEEATPKADSTSSLDWRLMRAEPRPVLWTDAGIFLIDPWNRTATFRIAFSTDQSPYSTNASKLFRAYNESIIGSPWRWYGGCGASAVVGVCGLPFTAWTEGSDLLIAYVVGNYSSNYPMGYGTAPSLRIARWSATNAVTLHDASLWAGRADDLFLDDATAELRHRWTSAGTMEVYVAFRQVDMWERLYRAQVDTATGSVSSLALARQEPQRSMGGIISGLAEFQAGVALLLIDDPAYAPYWGPVTGLRGAYSADGAGQVNYHLPVANVSCGTGYDYYYRYYYWDYGYYLPYYYDYPSCGRWNAIDWGGELSLLLYDDQRPRFFAPNHAPSAPRLLAPEEAARFGRLEIGFRATPSTDIDHDPLTYRITVFDGAGRLVVDQNVSQPTLDWKLPDGNYTWTVSVTDGFVVVPSPDTFRFDIDGSPPLADAGGPYYVHPGDGLVLNASASYDAGGLRRYRWTIGGVQGLALESTEPTLALTWDQLARFFEHGALVDVQLVVEDILGLEASDGSLIQVLLDPIELDFVVLTVHPVEGGVVVLGVNATWGPLRFTWDNPSAAVGQMTFLWQFPDGTNAAGMRVAFVADDSGTLVVNITAVSGAGATGFLAAQVLVANLPPSAEIDGPRQFAEGETGDFRVSATDPSHVDNRTLRVEWSVEGGVEIVESGAFTARLKGTANGPARLTARVVDKDGGETTATFDILVAEAADPVSAVWLAGIGSTWADLRWKPTGESDFVRYEILIRSEEGALLQTIDAGVGDRGLDRLMLTGLQPSTPYTFEVVVVALGEVRSPPVDVSGTTAPPDVAPTPPVDPPTLPPSGPPPPSPGGPANGGAITTRADGFGALGLLLAASGVFIGLLYFRTRRRGPDTD